MYVFIIQFITPLCILSCVCFSNICSQKQCSKQLICMLLTSNLMHIGPENDASKHVKSIALRQKIAFYPIFISILYPASLSFFSRLKVLKCHFRGYNQSKYQTIEGAAFLHHSTYVTHRYARQVESPHSWIEMS